MTRPNDPVYPHPGNNNAGITLREHFAALALQGLMAGWNPLHRNDEEKVAPRIAAMAVKAADALLAALNAPANGQ